MSEDQKAHFKKIIKKCRAVNDHRTRIVHGEGVVGRQTGRVYHVSRQTLEQSAHYEDADELAVAADDVRIITDELDPYFWALVLDKLKERDQREPI